MVVWLLNIYIQSLIGVAMKLEAISLNDIVYVFCRELSPNWHEFYYYHCKCLGKHAKNVYISLLLYTIMILSFRTDRSGQTVQIQIRLLIRVYTVCNSICIFLMHYSMAKSPCSNFRVIMYSKFVRCPNFYYFYGTMWLTAFGPLADKRDLTTKYENLKVVRILTILPM